MEMNYRYTQHQITRGTRPDAETFNRYFLLKNVSVLRATYQIRLLVFLAFQNGKRLVIRVPSHCKAGESLKALMKSNPKLIEMEKV